MSIHDDASQIATVAEIKGHAEMSEVIATNAALAAAAFRTTLVQKGIPAALANALTIDFNDAQLSSLFGGCGCACHGGGD